MQKLIHHENAAVREQIVLLRILYLENSRKYLIEGAQVAIIGM